MRAHGLPVVSAAALLLLTAPAAPGRDIISLGQYNGRLGSLSEELEASLDRRESVRSLADVERRFPPTFIVRVGDQDIPVENGWLREGLATAREKKGWERERTLLSLKRRCRALRGELRAVEESGAVDPGPSARRMMEEIFSRGPYREAEPDPEFVSIGRRLSASINRALDAFVTWFYKATRKKPKPDRPALWPKILGGVLYTALIAGLVWLLSHTAILLYRRLRGTRLRAQKASPAPRVELRRFVPMRPERLLERSGALAGEGRYREAFRFLYLAVLHGLNGKRLIRFDGRKTNWEYLNALRGRRSIYDRLLSLTRLFDRIWYGKRPGDRGVYEGSRKVADEILSELK